MKRETLASRHFRDVRGGDLEPFRTTRKDKPIGLLIRFHRPLCRGEVNELSVTFNPVPEGSNVDNQPRAKHGAPPFDGKGEDTSRPDQRY